MTNDDAQAWVHSRYGADAVHRLDALAGLVLAENERQNLIAPSTQEDIWVRHLLDSAQLVPLAGERGLWMDVGTGGGFPGLVVALLRPAAPVLLVEPRRQRAEFLQRCVALLDLSNRVTVAAMKVQHIDVQAQVISARAVASVENLLRAALPCATTSTRWLLPRGRSGVADLADVQRRWRGVFHVEQSLTDFGSSILVMDGVTPR